MGPLRALVVCMGHTAQRNFTRRGVRHLCHQVHFQIGPVAGLMIDHTQAAQRITGSRSQRCAQVGPNPQFLCRRNMPKGFGAMRVSNDQRLVVKQVEVAQRTTAHLAWRCRSSPMPV